ncbi:hypothetical protein WJX72_004385 [[Myrmecia] bisecta]|uniref:Uncharacterized protein n=1 Tax=[Myrmecia] bisecta TaxID=41462 RepID=A0AAW1R5W4_9CHLO
MVSALGARSTALEALRGTDLTGKVAIVTGGNSGIGVETVRALAHAGAKVLLTSRSVQAGQKVAEEIAQSGVQGTVEVHQLDLADQASVHVFTNSVKASKTRLDILILNAGVMMCPKSTTKDGFEMQLGTNVHGHLALVQDLLPTLQAQAHPVRIVVVSSRAHTFPKRWFGGGIELSDLHWQHRPYNSWGAYGQSKLGNVLMAKELARRYAGTNIKAFSLHPGSIQTGLQKHSPFASFYSLLPKRITGSKTVAEGAATSIYAAVSPDLEQHSGAYLSNCAIETPSAAAEDAALAVKFYDQVSAEIKAGKPLPALA